MLTSVNFTIYSILFSLVIIANHAGPPNKECVLQKLKYTVDLAALALKSDNVTNCCEINQALKEYGNKIKSVCGLDVLEAPTYKKFENKINAACSRVKCGIQLNIFKLAFIGSGILIALIFVVCIVNFIHQKCKNKTISRSPSIEVSHIDAKQIEADQDMTMV